VDAALELGERLHFVAAVALQTVLQQPHAGRRAGQDVEVLRQHRQIKAVDAALSVLPLDQNGMVRQGEHVFGDGANSAGVRPRPWR